MCWKTCGKHAYTVGTSVCRISLLPSSVANASSSSSQHLNQGLMLFSQNKQCRWLLTNTPYRPIRARDTCRTTRNIKAPKCYIICEVLYRFCKTYNIILNYSNCLWVSIQSRSMLVLTTNTTVISVYITQSRLCNNLVSYRIIAAVAH